jgi:hypothetical protein
MEGNPGPGVDAEGRPVIDPTANVLAILETAVKRIDDLREAEIRRLDAVHNASHKRNDDLRLLEFQCIREVADLRAHYDEQLRKAESDRIDAIRAVDVGNVQRAAEVAAAQAETLRNQVAAAAGASQTSLAAALDPIQKDIADLRRAQYEAQGQKTQVVEGRSSNAAIYAIIGTVGLLILVMIAVATFIIANSGGA